MTLVSTLVVLVGASLVALAIATLADNWARARRVNAWLASSEALVTDLARHEAPSTNEAPSSSWDSWCELSDRLALDLAIATASRRIALAYSSN